MSLAQLVLFWLAEQPDPDGARMAYSAWTAFVDSIAGWLLTAVAITVATILVAYIVHARRRRVHTPNDLFTSFTPMKWLFLSVVPALIVGYRFDTLFTTTFPLTVFSPTLSALEVGVWTGFLTFVLGHLCILLPGVTPSRYRYRPLWFVMRFVGRPAGRVQES